MGEQLRLTRGEAAASAEHPVPVALMLRARRPGQAGAPEYTLLRYPTAVGRHPSNDIELADDSVSRYHARFERCGEGVRLLDLRSSNGTFVNGRRVQMAVLEDQDTVGFGSLEYTAVMRREGGAPAKAAGEEPTSEVHFLRDEEESAGAVFHEEPATEAAGALELPPELESVEDLRRARERLACFYRLNDVLRSVTTDETRLMRGVLDLLFDVLPVDRGVVLTRDREDSLLFRPVAVRSRQRERERIGISRTILQRCLREKVALLTRDAGQDLRLQGSDSVASSRMRSVMCVPLISHGSVLGFCHVDTTHGVRSFSQEDLAFLVNICHEVAMHVHNLRMMQEKIQSERMAAIGQTITGMAHSVKNILLLTQGGIEMMDGRLAGKHYESLEETWGLVRRGLERINTLVADMLNYTRGRSVDRQRLDINALLRELHTMYAGEMEKRRIDCMLDLDETLPELMLDRAGIEKALDNLLINAMEAVSDGQGSIALRTRRQADENLLLEILDTGPGIPKEVLPRLFIPFFTTKGSKGSGLGLPMVKKFVEDMGGRIEVLSEEGRGTCFRIWLNLAPGPRLAESPAPALPEEQ